MQKEGTVGEQKIESAQEHVSKVTTRHLEKAVTLTFEVNLGLRRVVHVRKALENDIKYYGYEGNKDHQQPGHCSGSKHMIAHVNKI